MKQHWGWYRFWMTLLMMLMLASMAGCASRTSSNSQEVLTESDEPETRKRARIRTELATGYFEQNKTNIALDEVKIALSADPEYVPAYILRGLIYMQLEDLHLAEDSLQRALSLQPNNPDARHNLGWMYCQRGRIMPAIEQFNHALAQTQYIGTAKTYLAKGVCELRANMPVDAYKSFHRSYELDPSQPIAAYNLAKLSYGHGEIRQAQFIMRRLNNSEAANAESLWLGIKIERKLGDMVAAEQLGYELGKRFAQSSQWSSYQRGAFFE